MRASDMLQYARLWSAEAIHQRIAIWVANEGRAIFDLSPSQLSALEAAAARGELHRFLEDAAKLNRPKAWTDLKDTLPSQLAAAIEQFRSGTTDEARAYRAAHGPFLNAKRDAGIQSDFLAALRKAYIKEKEKK